MNGYDFQKLKYVEDRLTTVGMEIALIAESSSLNLIKRLLGLSQLWMRLSPT